VKRYQADLGFRSTGAGVVMVYEDDRKPYPLKHHVRHSPTGFSWGYGGSGPSDLARCLLIDVFGEGELVERNYQDFKFQVVADWPQDEGWEITEEEIAYRVGVIAAERTRRQTEMKAKG
jgi:hypothetical protein